MRTATGTALDRSKPYVGALVLRALYRRFGDRWIVELLFDELLRWTDWIRDRRVVRTPSGPLVVLVGIPDQHLPLPVPFLDDLQGYHARHSLGLDLVEPHP